ncbi:MAG TPA: TonB-dependent receptor, partial [Opitutaceae bacterium]
MNKKSVWIALLHALLCLMAPLMTVAPVLGAESAAGIVSGRAVNGTTGAPVAGATVTVVGTTLSTQTDLEGNYRLAGVPAGVREVAVSREGFRPFSVSSVMVLAGIPTALDLPLSSSDDNVVKMQAFTISADVVQNSGVGLLSSRQKAIAVSDAIGSEQMSKLGFGTAASAMKAVTGASVVGGKYVYIRGLGERYSSTMVNGVEVPSADPDRRAVNMDMFPSDLIDAIVTTKSFTPDKPGNFTGGAVDMKTKEFPDTFTFSLSASFSHNSRVTGRDFLATGGNSNTWGRDDGSRDLPAELAGKRIPLRFSSPTVDNEIGALTRAFSPTVTPTVKDGPLNRSFAFAIGGTARLFNRRLGYAASLSYDRSFSGYSDGIFG